MAIYKRVGKRKTSYDVCYYDPEGKQKWKSFDKRKDAKDYEAKVRTAKRENRYHDLFDEKKETKITFQELAAKYEEIHQGQKCYKGFKDYMVRDLRAKFGDRKLSQISYLDLEDWRKKRMETPTKAGKPRAAGSVNGELAVFSHMMSKAVEWGMLETSPFKKGKRLMLKCDNRRDRYLSELEIEALLMECPRHLRCIVQVAYLTGMRREELLSLKWDQVRGGFIHLDGSITKSGKARKIPIGDRLDRVFKEVRRENQLKSEFVFCDPQGRRFKEVKRSFQGACRRAGIENFRFHDLRHTFASHLVMKGASLKAVQELLGHADLSMTMRYSHLSQEHLKDSVNLLNDLPDISKTLENPIPNKKADSLTSANLL